MARLRIIPRDERFFELFEEAADTAIKGAETLQRMFADMEHRETYRQQMTDIEHAGDGLIHEVMGKLNRAFVTPLDPEDIRAIANRLDDIIDCTQAAAERVILYHVDTPLPGACALVDVLLQTTREVKTVVSLFRDLQQRRAMLALCIEINRLENAGDRIYRETMSNLFRDGNVMELMRWKEIVEQIEQAIDECEELVDIIELTVMKHA